MARKLDMLARTALEEVQFANDSAHVSDEVAFGDRLIVALDVATVDQARDIVNELGDDVRFYKIGMQLQFAHGLELVEELLRRNKKVFLDSKLLDIGTTIKGAVANIAKMGVTFLTVHGNGKTIQSAVEGRGSSDLKILSVTLLTTLDAHDLRDLYGDDFTISVEDMVVRRATKALEAGADGVIASGKEAAQIRSIVGPKLMIVTPGIRPDGTAIDDQRRVMSPSNAIAAGADYLVMGRPILNAPARLTAVRDIFCQIQAGLDFRRAN